MTGNTGFCPCFTRKLETTATTELLTSALFDVSYVCSPLENPTPAVTLSFIWTCDIDRLIREG